jgi:hypothetical protein
MNISPIAIFVYKRPEHTRHMINSLHQNPESHEADITVYCDGPRSSEDLPDIVATREIVHELLPAARVVERENNMGLANSVISGVSEQCQKFGRVIVLEDDLILSPSAISYLNKGLERYADTEKVMHISAYMFPVKGTLPPSFFYREATCWGWATWERAWKNFQSDAQIILEYIQKNRLTYQFDVNNSMFFLSMLRKQMKGEIDSWAIRWYGSMLMHRGLSLHPASSLVQNHGFDGSGVHCNITDFFDVTLTDEIPEFPDEIIECREAVSAMMHYREKMHKSGVLGKLERMVSDFLNRI